MFWWISTGIDHTFDCISRQSLETVSGRGSSVNCFVATPAWTEETSETKENVRKRRVRVGRVQQITDI